MFPFQVKHTKSVADVDYSPSQPQPQPNSSSSFPFPNVAAPLALETGDVDDVIVDMWWERPDEQLKWDNVTRTLFPKCPQVWTESEFF